MKVLEINSFGNLSTGKIACQYARDYEKNGDECYVAYGRGSIPNDVKSYKIGNKFTLYLHSFLSRVFGKTGRYSKRTTKKFVKWIKNYSPDLIHIHNLHGYFINYEILFKYLKESNVKIEWTLHDCWSFTGHCAFFSFVNCDKWKTGCGKCPALNQYPKSIFDSSKRDFKLKKKLFTSIDSNNLRIITPSKWLADLVKESYMGKYEVVVKYNTINENVFKVVNTDLKTRLELEDKKLILGVASTWDDRKGLPDFIKLSSLLNSDEKIILIGLNPKQIEYLKQFGIIGVGRTRSQEELAEYYNIADVFFNPTKGDNYPTVNLEAQACGTYVLTYDTGGCKETNKGKLSVVNEPLDVIKYIRE